MIKIGRFFFACLTVFCAAFAAASSAAVALSEQQLDRLAEDKVWLHLVHIRPSQAHISEVNSPEFFVFENRHSSARQELAATLTQYNTQTAASSGNELVQCRFPARLYWLSYKTQQPQLRDFSACKKLLAWAKLETLDSVSLIMISGYFGNPASTFGHSLLRLNNSAFDHDSSLLDLGINFGAQVPPDESTFVYIIRGLLGGYQSGFSDKAFYEHDQTYSRVEFRDRWEYTLNLSEYQRTLLTLHLWEIAGKKFTYYFLHQNCSYRLAELLELVTGEDIVERIDVWYAPVSLFHDLRRLKGQGGQLLFTDVTYVPSIELYLRQTLASLDASQRRAFNQIISNTSSTDIEHLELGSQQKVYSAALDYFEYAVAGKEQDDVTAIKMLQQKALKKRISLPPAVVARPAIKHRAAPSELDPPTAFSIGLGYTRRSQSYMALGYGGFAHKATGKNTYDQSALVVFDLQVGVNDSNALFLDSLDLIRARKANAPNYFLPGEGRNAWEIALGVEAVVDGCTGCVESFFEGSIGRSRHFGANWFATAAVGGRVSSKGSALEVVPQLRVIHSPHQNWSTEANIAWLHAPLKSSDQNTLQYRIDSRISLRNNTELTLALLKQNEVQGHVAIGWRW